MVLILWLHFLSYAVELVQVILPILLLLLLFIHTITSEIVCTGNGKIYRKIPMQCPFIYKENFFLNP